MRVPYVDIGGQYALQRDEILEAIDRTLKSGQYILSEETETFEKNFAQLCGTKHAVGVANGTDSLILLMKVLGIGKPTDEVITAPNSWISSASSVALIGAKPVFIDVDDDLNMNPKLLEKAINKNTKAIMPVHLTGKIADMNPILEIAGKYNIPVIEDAAQSVGASYFGKKSGSMGWAGSFSLHPLKNLNAAGDAGIITTNDDELYEKLKLLRHHGIVTRTEIKMWGYNSRLDSLQAAILNVRIKYLQQINESRRKNAQLYRSLLGKIVQCPNDRSGCYDVYHLFVIQCDRRDELQKHLSTKEISTAIHYPTPIHLYEAAKDLGYKKGDFPKTEMQAGRMLSLPVHQNLSEEQIRFVANSILEFYS